MWERSAEKYYLWYSTMLSDGDSRPYKELVTSKVYGEEKIVEKDDCVNYVAKRMGTALNDVVAEAKAQGSSVSWKKS